MQMLTLQHKVRAIAKSLPMLRNAINTHTIQLFHFHEGQLKLVHELKNTTDAVNRTIAILNQHSNTLDNYKVAFNKLANLAKYINKKLTPTMRYIEAHFLLLSIAEILSNHLIGVLSITSFLLLLHPSKAHFLFMNYIQFRSHMAVYVFV
jgi:hypothetical protein